MTKSMTAFARAQAGQVAWELRSVNQRYLDPGFKIPDNMRVLEPELRNFLRARVHRGKIDCVLRIDSGVSETADPVLDQSQLERLQQLLDQLGNITRLAPVNPLEVLKWPGILKEDSAEFDELLHAVQQVFEQAVESLITMREREGAELEKMVLERLEGISAIVADVRTALPVILENHQQKLREKITEIGAEVDAGRLEQELVYLAQKSDVAEELDRLDAHMEEVRTTLKGEGAIGRRLDFLMQELNREANTLSSKSIAADVSIQAVELKVMIEQMREQIQNIE